jgi:Transglutaminase-like superfamily
VTSSAGFGLTRALSVAGVAAVLPVLDVSLNVIGLGRTLALLAPVARPPRVAPPPNRDAFGHAARAIDGAAGFYRRSGRCLRRSILLWLWLTRHGASAVITLGAKHLDGRLAGHAWVEVAGEVVAEPADGLRAFVVFARYGDPADAWRMNRHDSAHGTTVGQIRPAVVK